MLKVGQNVVLIREEWGPHFTYFVPQLPKAGVVYTVRWIGRAPKRGYPTQLRLVELVNPVRESSKYNYEASFAANRFRPLVKLTTEQFVSGLTPVDHLELNLEYQGIKA